MSISYYTLDDIIICILLYQQNYALILSICIYIINIFFILSMIIIIKLIEQRTVGDKRNAKDANMLDAMM
jgi:hypothetical protein